MPKLVVKPFFVCGFVASLSVMVACSTSPSSGVAINPLSGRPELTEAFRTGSSRLECRTSCAGAWGSKRGEMKALHDAELWTELAVAVLNLGFRSDQTYYYLGRAAEGLGYDLAAVTYYRLSTVATKTNDHKCGGWINNCDDFVFPRDAEGRLTFLLEKQRKAQQSIVQRADDNAQISSSKEHSPSQQVIASSSAASARPADIQKTTGHQPTRQAKQPADAENEKETAASPKLDAATKPSAPGSEEAKGSKATASASGKSSGKRQPEETNIHGFISVLEIRMGICHVSEYMAQMSGDTQITRSAESCPQEAKNEAAKDYPKFLQEVQMKKPSAVPKFKELFTSWWGIMGAMPRTLLPKRALQDEKEKDKRLFQEKKAAFETEFVF